MTASDEPHEPSEEEYGDDRKLERDLQLGQTFSPSAPIDQLRLFAGRSRQMSEVVDVIIQRGRHAVLYGERGVGKTSLASVLREHLQNGGQQTVAARVNCDVGDNYASVWRKVFKELRFIQEDRKIGFAATSGSMIRSLDEVLNVSTITPDVVRSILSQVGRSSLLIIIIDEFDRFPDGESHLFSDTIKMLSDHSSPVTIILVGVADTVESLIRSHQSIERAIAQVRIPRMDSSELNEIIQKALADAGMTMDDSAQRRIISLSQGLPHYTHLVGLYAARNANRDDREHIGADDVHAGIRNAVVNGQESIIASHHRAIMSSRRESLYREVALACALARTDDRGFFTASAVRIPMGVIMGKPYEIAAFARHMNEFCQVERGPILSKIGVPRNYRFRFINPLLQPYVIMDGFEKEIIDEVRLDQIAESR